MMLLLSTLMACQVMDNPGHVFSSVAIANETESHQQSEEVKEGSETAESEKSETSSDPLFQDPQEDVIQMGVDSDEEGASPEVQPAVVSSEEIATEQPTVETSIAPTVTSAPNPAASTWRPATVKDGWRPTLLGTLMDGPTPRAILAMPSGEEKVIKAGDMLSEDGVVVMTIGANFVELAVINSTEGRAKIENLTLSTQF